MTEMIAALAMYDWPEMRAETDAEWARLREAFRAAGLNAPEHLVRRNADMPSVPGGIMDAEGNVVAPDPATLPSDELHLPTLWHHPALLFTQTCWGPMELWLAPHVRVVGQPDYSAFVGGRGEFYSSAILMRAGGEADAAPSEDGTPSIPFDLIRGKRLGYNSDDSMSGIIALTRDLEAAGEGLDLFSELVETGGHRLSIVAVAEGRADVCAVDCRSLALARRFEPAVAGLRVVGWTGLRKGLPFIVPAGMPDETFAKLQSALKASAQPAMSLASNG
ncbi:phosphate/phosphite/phosphonate ABC transporter substrate-binding protein [Pseudaminobacter soli (ex Li et al. 2025)]|uniref:Phosphate ABC transporter substrate-binding protein n=1 Tax=Pseudaminobacter soli (ex Li et al. 2025) TaxID=1295366 RepID=A0A2P7SMZ4_9HYPH|nr:PhnD/SsuA/transferrin family substrate-binding protein [Mesorhizobium soli]PSJ63852.1 phosphate ABC transporter substrate-binding protein [Mesorhizobium soli]